MNTIAVASTTRVLLVGDVAGHLTALDDVLNPFWLRVTSDRAVSTFWRPRWAHSGQWKPTDALIMHWGQMGRSQRWQATPARRSPWR